MNTDDIIKKLMGEPTLLAPPHRDYMVWLKDFNRGGQISAATPQEAAELFVEAVVRSDFHNDEDAGEGLYKLGAYLVCVKDTSEAPPIAFRVAYEIEISVHTDTSPWKI